MEPRETKPEQSASLLAREAAATPEKEYRLDEWGVVSPEETAAELLRDGGWKAIYEFTHSTAEGANRPLVLENLALHISNGHVFTVRRLSEISKRASETFTKNSRSRIRTFQWWITEMGVMMSEEQAPAVSLTDKHGVWTTPEMERYKRKLAEQRAAAQAFAEERRQRREAQAAEAAKGAA